ncbi:MAG: anthranilate phosphoribosyltransferase [Candidatus Paceibacteria bacterium]|jgi:anthranilate phosphoribosyltransferase
MSLRDYLRVIAPGQKDVRNLTRSESYRAFDAIMHQNAGDATIAAFFVALRAKGVTVDELAGFASAARDHATLACEGLPGLVCVCPPLCGTEHTPPLGVASALIATGAGARVLLQTDRNVPPARGLTAVNVLEHLGAGVTWDPHEAEDWVDSCGFAAIAVSGMLPVLMNLRSVREGVFMRTALSTVEKLVCPSSASVLVGAQSGPVLGVAVEVMQSLGHHRACAIQGLEGGTTPSVRRRTRGIEISDEHLVSLVVEPEDFGLQMSKDPELPLFSPPMPGEGASDNPSLVRAAGELNALVLAGEPGAERNAALLGAALILKTAGRCMTLAEGVDAAMASLDSGAASAVLSKYRELQSL